jgi:hypothetical protein
VCTVVHLRPQATTTIVNRSAHLLRVQN